MLNAKLWDARNSTRKDWIGTYESWRDKNIPNANAFPLIIKTEVIAGRERQWRVASFGEFKDQSGNIRRFVAYRCGLGTLCKNYSWVWRPQDNMWQECALQQFGSW